MFSERCPECDIELISANGGEDWFCPLCNLTPTPDQYVKPNLIRMPDTTEARDAAIKACETLIELAKELPEYTDTFRRGYFLYKELAEIWDQST